jgi:hypothetical protein
VFFFFFFFFERGTWIIVSVSSAVSHAVILARSDEESAESEEVKTPGEKF